MKNIEVVAAIMIYEGRFLCVQRGESDLDYISKKWEFPGGKVEPGESLEVAIRREIREELKTSFAGCDFFMTVEHQYPDFYLKMHSFTCHMPSNAVTLTEHLDFKWLDPGDMKSLDWAAADVPIVQEIMRSSHDI